MNASLKRSDNKLTSFEAFPDKDLYGYHRLCYQSYTNVRVLGRLSSPVPSTVDQELRRSGRDKQTGSKH